MFNVRIFFVTPVSPHFTPLDAIMSHSSFAESTRRAGMTDVNSRIEQFRKMAEADPDNELGHFSLGRAYLDAGYHADAIRAFQRVLELKPDFSKVFHLLATAQ